MSGPTLLGRQAAQAGFSPVVPTLLGRPAAQNQENIDEAGRPAAQGKDRRIGGAAPGASGDGPLAGRHLWLHSAIQEMRGQFCRLYQERSLSGCLLSAGDVRNLAECAVGFDPLSGSVFLSRPIDSCMVAIPEQCELAWCCLTRVMSEEEWSRETWKILNFLGKLQVHDVISRSTAQDGSPRPRGRRGSAAAPGGRRRSSVLPRCMRRLVSRQSGRSCNRVAPETSEVSLPDKVPSPKARIYPLSL